jgi:uncharacterized protein
MSMRKSFFLLLLTVRLAGGQPATTPASGQSAMQPVPAATATGIASGAAFVRENYTKFEYRIAMRDTVRLFTSVYIPKEVFTEGRSYPILLQRTPYNVQPYGIDKYRGSLGPSELFARERFIFAYQDVRGRYMSEGDFTIVRPHKPVKGPKDTDESTDCYDTVEWLVKNVPGNTGKVGMWGVSQPGFFAAAGMIDAHPALVAVSPQAPVTDYYMGDDSYHNGAFMLAHRFRFYQGFLPRDGDPSPPGQALPFEYGTPDGYEFYLNMGSLAEADEKYFKHRQVFWTQNIENPNYNEFWQTRSIWKHLQGIKPAVMIVGGWYDQEDPQGPLRQFDFMTKNSPPQNLMLVMGPWNHGGFSRGDGEKLGSVYFGSKTGAYYREKIEFPFFLYHLKGRGEGKFPQAWLFQTGMNQWLKLDSWPPKQAQLKTIYLDAKGILSWQQPTVQSFDEYLADPSRPVPFINAVTVSVPGDYMVSDQRFAATRPDVLVYRSESLAQDMTVVGSISVDLKVSTTGTDSDFDVKLIDVYPGDYPDFSNLPVSASGGPPSNAPAITQMGGYQQLIRGEPFRGKYRRNFEKPVPFEPGKPDRIQFMLPDVAHTFRAGHRIMIQIQSSWFPLTDRNPQKFMDIPKAKPADFQKATQRIFAGGADGSRIQLLVMESAGDLRPK